MFQVIPLWTLPTVRHSFGLLHFHIHSNCTWNSTHRPKLHTTPINAVQEQQGKLTNKTEGKETLKKQPEINQRIYYFDYGRENLKQYGCRTFLIDNVSKPGTDETGADKRSVVINICAKNWSHINFGLCLPVPRGRPTEITKFKLSMKRAKKEFKNNGDEIFVTQDLTIHCFRNQPV